MRSVGSVWEYKTTKESKIREIREIRVQKSNRYLSARELLICFSEHELHELHEYVA